MKISCPWPNSGVSLGRSSFILRICFRLSKGGKKEPPGGTGDLHRLLQGVVPHAFGSAVCWRLVLSVLRCSPFCVIAGPRPRQTNLFRPRMFSLFVYFGPCDTWQDERGPHNGGHCIDRRRRKGGLSRRIGRREEETEIERELGVSSTTVLPGFTHEPMFLGLGVAGPSHGCEVLTIGLCGFCPHTQNVHVC